MLISDCEDTAGTITANLSCRSQTMLISDCEDTAGTITADLNCRSQTMLISDCEDTAADGWAQDDPGKLIETSHHI